MVPPPFRVSVRNVAPSFLDISHFSIAGCQLAIPQKSPMVFQTESGDAGTSTIFLTSTAKADPAKQKLAAAIRKADFLIVPFGVRRFLPSPIVPQRRWVFTLIL